MLGGLKLPFPAGGKFQRGTVSAIDSLEARLREPGRSSTRFARAENSLAVAALAARERAVPFWPLTAVHELQRRRIREVLQHAYATVPFYRDALDEIGLHPNEITTAEDLRALPCIDGGMLAQDTMRFVASPFRHRGREVFKTSGSSAGLRKPIFWDHASLLVRAARGERDRVVIAKLAGERWSHMIARELLINERRHSAARLFGIDTQGHQRLFILPADFSSRTQRTIYSERTVIPRKPVHYQHLPPTAPFEVAAAHIAALRPRVVLSFGSYADQFFRYLDASGTRIPLPRLWIYLGDRLSPDGRDLAENAGCLVYSTYGAMEAGTIGFQCEERDGFHLNIDLCAVRVVDDDGCEVPAGDPGEVVISALDNRAMVLLNYRMGDRAVLSTERCRCGRTLPFLSRLEGRRSESVRLTDGRELSSLTVEAMFGSELRRTIQAQLEEEAPGRMRWRIVPFAEIDREELRDAIIARGRRALGADTSLSVEFVEEISRTAAGKFVRAARKREEPAIEAADAAS